MIRARPRVLILSWEYPPLIQGGLARHVGKLAAGLAGLGIRVHVLTRGGEGAPADEEVGEVVVHRIREPAFPADVGEFVAWVEGMNADLLAAGVELSGRFDFDLVHGHDWLTEAASIALARRFHAPLVTTFHATEHGRHQGWVGDRPQSDIHAAERRLADASDRVIVCSAYMREQVAAALGIASPERIEVIHNGVDPEDLRVGAAEADRARAELAAPGGSLVLLAGRLVYEKGFRPALEAIPRVIEAVPGTRFLVAGSGPQEEELRRRADELGVTGKVTFLGWVDDEALRSLYAIADLTVVPSIYEPFGLVALEAMAAGCPCIVADAGGLREVVPDAVGLRFAAGEPGALAEAAIRVLADPGLRARLVAAAREHVRRFDWAEVAERTAAVYDELPGARPAVG